MNWKPVKLDALFKIKHGFAFKSEFFAESGKYVLMTPGHFYEQGGFRKREGKEKFYSGQFNSDYLLKKGDLVIAMTEQGEGLLGSTAKVPEADRFLHNQRLGLAHSFDKEVIEKDFLYFLLNRSNVRAIISSTASGTKVRHTSPGRILAIEVLIPKIETQRRIASILTAYDDLIENNLRRIRLLEEVAQRTFEEWFVRCRVGGLPLELDEGTGLPRGWVRKGLGELGDYLNGYPFKPAELGEKGYPIIKIKELKNGVVADTPRNSGETIAKRYFVERGELLFSWSASLEVVLWQNEKGLLNQHLFKVTPKNGIPKSFLFLSLKDSLPIFSGLTTGSTMKHIKRKELDFVTVCVPTEPELEKFDKSIQPVLDLISNLNRQNAHLKTARDLLLPRLMTGEIEVGEEVIGK